MDKKAIADQVMKQFLNYYTPAKSIAVATDFLSTQEICAALNQFAPGSGIKDSEIYELMIQNGFNYAPDPSKIRFQLKWLLCRKA